MKGQLKGSEERQQTIFEAASIIGTFVLNYIRRNTEKNSKINGDENVNATQRSASIGSEGTTSVESEFDGEDFALYTTNSHSGNTIERDDEFGSRSPSPISGNMDVLSNTHSTISEDPYISSDAENELDSEGLAENEDQPFVIHHNENDFTAADNDEDNFVDIFMDNNPLDNSDELNVGFIEVSTETDAEDESFISQESTLWLLHPTNLFGNDTDVSGDTDSMDESF